MWRRRHRASNLSRAVSSLLVLDFATVIQLTEEYFAPGSLGQLNLQVSVDVVNNQTAQWTKDQYELLIMTMNTGVFVNEKGTSSTFTGLLTKEDVITASQQQPYTHSEIRRFVGGSFLSGLKSAMGWVSSTALREGGPEQHPESVRADGRQGIGRPGLR